MYVINKVGTISNIFMELRSNQIRFFAVISGQKYIAKLGTDAMIKKSRIWRYELLVLYHNKSMLKGSINELKVAFREIR